MNFWDYDKNERDDWRKQDITRAYLEELRRQADGARKTCMASIRDGVMAASAQWAGVVEGIENAASIAGDDK